MKKVIKNYLYNASYNVFNILIPLITAPYIARILGTSGVGIYAFNYTIVQYFSLFAKLGLTHYGTRCIAKSRDNQQELKKVFSNIYAMQILSTLIVSTIYYIYVFIWADNIPIASIFGIWLISIVFDTDWFLFGLENFKITAIRNFIVKIVSALSVFLFVHSERDIWLYAIITSLSYAVGYVCIWTKCKKYISLGEVKIELVIKHIRPCCILLISVLALSIYRSMDKVMLGTICGMHETGLYDYAEKLIYCLVTLIASLGSVMLPKMSNLAAKKDIEHIKKYISLSMFFIMFFSNGMAFGLMSISNKLIPLIYGDKFMGSIELLNLLGITLVAIGWGNVIRSQYLIPNKKDKVYVITVCLGALMNLVINYILIPKYRAIGACIGTICTEFFVQIIQGILIYKELPYKRLLLQTFPFMMFGFIMYNLLIELDFQAMNSILDIFLRVVIGFIIYGGFSFIYYVGLKKRKLL